MNALLVKLFATALTFSQVATKPDDIRTSFDPATDRDAVVQSLRDGCAHMRKAFDIEDINLDDLLATAMEDPLAVAGQTKILKDLDFKDLERAYRQFCKNEPIETPVVDLGEVAKTYNEAMADLPDASTLKSLRLPGASLVLDEKGRRFAELHKPDGRRVPVPLADVPPLVRKAFVAAEDKRFFEHRGLDERGVIRAFVNNLAKPGRPQGGSTITQQVAKNLLVGDDVTYARKMREMVVAARLERLLSKDEILEIYLNAIYLGRGAWGVEMASRTFFGKSVKSLTLSEAALLASLPKGPNYYDPEKAPERSRERVAYVLSRLLDDKTIDEATRDAALAARPVLVAAERGRHDSGFHFLDHLNREARMLAGVDGLTASAFTVRTTLDAALQRSTEAALQEGLSRYELSTGRFAFSGPEGNLAAAIERGRAPTGEGKAAKPDWLRALETFRAPLYDVHWPVAVVVDARPGALKVGLRDGRVVPLTAWRIGSRRELKLHDVVHVRVADGKGARAELRVRPAVQGAAVVLENRTGRILAMSGGFSYPLSQLNRATQSLRQPGSTLKPLTFLAALAGGVQPNTLVWDSPVTLTAIGGVGDDWTPRNYDRTAGSLTTVRRALEGSRNLVTARLLDGVIASRPEDSLSKVCALALEAQLYAECERYYPFVLGSQPVRLLDLAALYATVANEGERPTPYGLEAVEEPGRVLYRHEAKPLVRIGSADRAAFFQLKSMLQGVVARGTASAMSRNAAFLGGKTGTSENENDAWFAGFSNDVTVVVWVGHDNADGKRRTLGRGQTGAKVALPIFKSIMDTVWAGRGGKAPLAPPSPEARAVLAAVPSDLRSGDTGTGGAFVEWLRRSPSGQVADTQYRFVGREQAYAGGRFPDRVTDDDDEQPWATDRDDGYFPRVPDRRSRDSAWALPEDEWEWPGQPRRRLRRVDPDYPWTERGIN